jgi:Asparagine synthase
MGKFLTALHRREIPESAGERVAAILAATLPGDFPVQPDVVVRCRGAHAQGTLDVGDREDRDGLALCMGKLFGPTDDWWRPGTAPPDGSYALVREDGEALELVSDPGGSRMIYYHHGEDMFVASNSERAIAMYTGRFDFDRETVPWLVSTGTRGPSRSFSRHVRLLPPAAVLRLDKVAWRLQLDAEEIRFVEIPRSHEEHLAALGAALDETFRAFGPADAARMIIALSGGCDSRAVASLLARNAPARWQSYSFGTPEATGMPRSDVAIAAQVAEALGMANRHLAPGPVPEAAGDFLRRFVVNNEGRHDHFARVGAAPLPRFRAEGTDGVIRGDEALGWKPTDGSALTVRGSMELLLCGDIAELRPHLQRFGLASHALPPELEQRAGESLETWRDRLYASFRAPTVLAALNESKSHYFDTVNPLLSRRVLAVIRSVPDAERTDKALFRELVRRLGPDLPFAGVEGIPQRHEALRHPEVLRAIRDALASETAQRSFGAPLVRWLRSETHPVRSAATRLVRAVARRTRRLVPAAPDAARHVPTNRIALRVYIATTMIDQLTADAARFPTPAASPG